MIKRETKYIIRRILIGFGIALILAFINACDVKAESYTYYFYNTPIYYYNGNTLNISRTPTTYNTTYVYGGYGNNTTNIIIWKNDVNLSFTNVSFVTFNVVIKHSIQDGKKPIRNVSFLDMPCNYAEHNADQAVENSIELSAICYVNKPMTIQANSNFVTIQTEFVNLNQVSISSMNIINNQDLLQIIRNKMNDLNQNLSEINLEIYRIEGVVNSISTAINNQSTQQHNDSQAEINAQNNTTNAINDMNDTLKNDNVDSPNNSISQMEQNLPTNSVISDLLTLPIRMFQNIVNAIDGTCSSFALGSLFGTNLVLPCINISNYLGTVLWSSIDVIFCGIFVLSMRKKFVEIFENITSLKNGGNELE